MALNSLTPNTDFVQRTAESRRIVKPLVADFTFDIFSHYHRNKIFLMRNMTKVLAFHERNRTRGLDALSRTRGPYLDSSSTTRKASIAGAVGNGTLVPNLHHTGGRDASSGYDTDTAKPDVETMSQECLRAKAQNGQPDESSSQKRRSVRHQLLRQHEDRNAQLYFDIVNIRKKLNFKQKADDGDNRPRKRVRRESIPCHCHITIWDNRRGLEQKEPIVRKSETCEVSTVDLGVAGFSADIKLRKPFILKSSELNVSVNTPHGSILGIGDQYFLEIKILPTKEDVDWPPVPVLGRSEGDQTTGLGRMAAEKLQGSLVARYLHLPHAPASDVPLSVFYLHDSRTYRSKYGLEVRAEWTKGDMPEIMLKHEEDDTAIDLWALDDEGRSFGRGEPPHVKGVPAASTTKARGSQAQKPLSPVKVIFNLDAASAKGAKDFRKAGIVGLRCPACPRQTFGSVQDMQFHFLTSHSKYKFTVEKEDFNPSSNELTSVVFKVTSVGTARPRNHDREQKPNDKDLDWQAPKEPLNVRAYVNGNQDWVEQNWMEGPPKRAEPAAVPTVVAVHDPVTAMRQKMQNGSAPAQKGGFLPAEHVTPFRSSDRKKYPNIRLRTMTTAKDTMYTSVSHRQVRVGEGARSESDDEMDDGWFIKKTLEALDIAAEKQNWTNDERLLRRKWNQARLTERLSHPRYLSDCLVRFVKAQRAWLATGGVGRRSAFAEFLDELLQRHVINQEVVRDLWTILHEDEQKTSSIAGTNQDASQNQDGGKYTSPPTASNTTNLMLHRGLSQREKRAETMLRLPPNTCAICLEAIAELRRQGVRCSDHECEAPGVWYHSGCVRCKKKDKLSWKCSLCTERLELLKQSKGKEIALS